MGTFSHYGLEIYLADSPESRVSSTAVVDAGAYLHTEHLKSPPGSPI